MVKKRKTYIDRIREWRQGKEEAYARAIMETPEQSTLLKCIPYPGVVLIMGSRRFGKTGTAHEIGEQEHRSRHVPVMLHLPPTTPAQVRTRIQKIVPPWIKVTTRREDWERGSVIIYDEAAQTAHARRTQSGDAVELDNLIGCSGQRGQTLIFICHHSRKLDPNVVREVNRIIWKRPTYAYQLFERDELIDYTMKAYDYFTKLRKGKTLNELSKREIIGVKRANIVLDLDDFRFLTFENKLPSYWTDELSSLFENIKRVGPQAPGY